MLKTHLRKLLGLPQVDPFPFVFPPPMLRQKGWEKGTFHMQRWCSVIKDLRDRASAAEDLLQKDMACYHAMKAFVSQLFVYIDKLQRRVYKKLMSGKSVSNKYYDWVRIHNFQRVLKLAVLELGYALARMKWDGIYDDVEQKIIKIHAEFTKEGLDSVLVLVTKMNGWKMHQQILELLEVDRVEYWKKLDEAGKKKQLWLKDRRRQEVLVRDLRQKEQMG